MRAIQSRIFATPLMLQAPQAMVDRLGSVMPFPQCLGMPAKFVSLTLELQRNGHMNVETIRLDGAIRTQPR